MNELDFRRQKLLQILHDPPAKPFAMMPGKTGKSRGGHRKVAANIAGVLAKTAIKYFKGIPDYAAAGADRPIFPGGRGAKERIRVQWPHTPLITHPLSPGYRLSLRHGGVDAELAGTDIRESVLAIEDAAIKDLSEDRLKEGQDPGAWNSSDLLEVLFITVWRKLRHLLARKGPEGDEDPDFRHLWQTMPADGRCPDHSIWDHNRLTSALAFMTAAKGEDSPRDPWLLRFEIGPVSRFIEEAETSRDLWMGSFLLSDITWHAMAPIVRRYGPDCIVYPDLRANPRADVWLKEKHPGALPHEMEDPATYAAVLPNAFTAVVPLGEKDGNGHLIALDDLAGEAASAAQDRWSDLAALVEEWIAGIQGSGPGDEWRAIWKRQHQKVLHSTWSAVRWSEMEKIKSWESLSATDPLPCQFERSSTLSREEQEEDRRKIMDREHRLKPFVPGEVWAHYSHARAVFARTNLPVHQLERGFDYALTHHQLRMRHALRKQQSAEAGVFGEQGEKCTLCGLRQALYNLGSRPDKLHGHRQAAREFWKPENNRKRRLNPDPLQLDRLCGVCAMKRFLVEAGVDNGTGKLTGINPVWAGVGKTVKDLKFKDDIPRVPFPSTATVAAQKYLEAICTRQELASERAAVEQCSNQARLPRTGFARSLSRLAALERDPASSGFLMLDTQQSVFPETLEISVRQAEQQKDPARKSALEKLERSVIDLRGAARKAGIEEPGTGIAIIRLDGDNMGRLLLGDPEIIQTTWRDVIHPEAVFSDKQCSLLTAQITREAGWPDLLESKTAHGTFPPCIHQPGSGRIQPSHRALGGGAGVFRPPDLLRRRRHPGHVPGGGCPTPGGPARAAFLRPLHPRHHAGPNRLGLA